MQSIEQYFPELTERQRQQFAALDELYRTWNARINVISRKDIDALYEHHVLHSLGIAKAFPFADGTKVMDLGTGGGFPGIPRAIEFVQCGKLLPMPFCQFREILFYRLHGTITSTAPLE